MSPVQMGNVMAKFVFRKVAFLQRLGATEASESWRWGGFGLPPLMSRCSCCIPLLTSPLLYISFFSVWCESTFSLSFTYIYIYHLFLSLHIWLLLNVMYTVTMFWFYAHKLQTMTESLISEKSCLVTLGKPEEICKDLYKHPHDAIEVRSMIPKSFETSSSPPYPGLS